MKLSLSPFTRRALACSALLAGTGLASAQTNIAGNLSDDTTGPLLSGVVYHATSQLLVPAGKTLTIQAGAIVKFTSAGLYVDVSGTLNALGTAGQPIVLTDIRDDSAGGDTNNDGAASSPAPGFRRALFVESGAAVTLQHTELRYGGWNSEGQVQVQSGNASLVMDSCVVRDGSNAGLRLGNTKPTLSVSNCSFVSNGVAVDHVRLDVVPSFIDNTASGNAANYMRVTVGTIASDTQIGPHNVLGGALVHTDHITVPNGLHLYLEPGTVLKPESAGLYWDVGGTLDSIGASGQPVVITDFRDDSAGGDTNNDGAGSSPTPGFRRALFVENGSAVTLRHTELRYGGWNSEGQVQVQSANASLDMDSCVVRDGSNAGLRLGNTKPTLAVSNCAFVSNGVAVDQVRLDVVPGFTDNTATGNASNYLRITVGTISSDTQIGPHNVLGGALAHTDHVTVPNGTTLTLLAGTVLKPESAGLYWDVHGVLDAQGTAAEPVVLTDFRDDTIGGDTNNDAGASIPVAGNRRALFAQGNSSVTLAYTELRYGGWNSEGQVQVSSNTASLAMSHCVVRDGSNAGLRLGNTKPTLSVANCAFVSNGVAVDQVRLDVVPGFTDNTATGNAANYIRVTVGTISSDTQIGPHNTLGGALVHSDHITIPLGLTLELLPSTVLKAESTGLYWVIGGRLVTTGGADHPPILTSIVDDSVGGDTNGDGNASTPTAGFRRTMFFDPSTDVSSIDGLTVRYAGWNSEAGARLDCATLQPKWLRVEHSLHGIDVFDVGGDVAHWIAWDCSGIGVWLRNDSIDVRHATVVGCGVGFQRETAFGGHVVDSIAWSCTQATQGFDATRLRYSDGDAALAGVSGNLAVDPLFFDGANGDFHLTLASPCIDSGDPLSPPDADSTRSDMGAYSFDFCTPRRYCAAKVTSNGCTPTIDWSGTSSITGPDNLRIKATNVMSKKNGVLMWGLAANAQAFHGGTLCVASPLLRKPVLSSGGNLGQNDCSGAFDTLFDHAYMQAHGVGVGDVLHLQFWFRDSGFAAPDAVGLSDALTMMVCP